MNNKNKVVLSIIFIVLIVLIYQNNQLRKDFDGLKNSNALQAEVIEKKEDEIDEVSNRYEEALKSNETLENEISVLSEKNEEFKIIDEITKIKLEDMGIDDYKIIEEDLLSKPELISIKGILGGTMYFTDVYLLNDQWVYATFEDGHIMGYGLYEFDIVPSGEIKWEEIEAISD